MAIKQTKEDLFIHLKDCCDSLEISSKAFDDGYVGEGKRLATTLRVLLHDTLQSKSLLNQLKIKTQMYYINTAQPYDVSNLLCHHGLVFVRKTKKGDGAEFFCIEDKAPWGSKLVSFPVWWNEDVIIDQGKNKFSRKDLILALSNKDGGAHVDPQLTDKYGNLSRNNSVGWFFDAGDGSDGVPLISIELYCLRQMAFEFLGSIKRKFPDLFV